MTPVLAIEELELGYDATPVVCGASLTVAAGHVRALLGRNGSGKSTLLRGVAGVLRPRRGRVVLNGVDVAGWSPRCLARTGLSYVAQSRECFPDLTVAEHFQVALSVLDQSGPARRAARDEAYARFPALQAVSQQPVRHLSGGLRQILVIAMALARRPRCILLDEPTLGLSSTAMHELATVIRDFARAGGAVLLVEQKPRFALDASDDISYLESGRIVITGETSRLRSDTAFLNRYLGLSRPAKE